MEEKNGGEEKGGLTEACAGSGETAAILASVGELVY